MAVKFLDKTGLGYFWGKIKAWCNSTFAAIAHTHTSYAVKHSYTTAANAAKNWYRIANANTSQLDTTKPIRAQFIVTAYNTSYAADYYETWFVNAIVFGRQAHIVIFGGSGVPFSQARILYENTVANIDANDRPAIDLYLNYVLPNGTTKIEIEEIYNNGSWTFVADGQLAASTVPSGFESVASTIRYNGIDRSTIADYASYLNRQISNITAAFTLADSYLYRSRTLNCTGTFTITIPSLNSGYMWCVIKNKNTSSGVITLHPSTTSVLIDGSNADIKLQPMEYVCIHSAGANNYSLIADGRWKSQKADKATTLAGYGITDAKIANGTITLGSNSITPLTSVPSHNQASNTITAMTGYSKPSSGSAIAVSDSLNSAIGKLEAKVDNVDDSNYVHKTGDETITGLKVFEDNLEVYGINDDITTIGLKSNIISIGEDPATDVQFRIIMSDQMSTLAGHRFGIFRTFVYTNGDVASLMEAFQNVSSNQAHTAISVVVKKDGTKYATAPSTLSSRSEGTDILTRDWIPKDDRIVRTSGDQTISGNKTFTSDIVVGNHDVRTTSDADFLVLNGGEGESQYRAGRLALYGKDYPDTSSIDTTIAGYFNLSSTDGTNVYKLIGSRSGTLTWRGNSIWAGITNTGSGNAVTSITVGSNNVVTVAKGSTFLTALTNVSEMGRYIDFHYDNATAAYNYDVRLGCSSQGSADGGGNLTVTANAMYIPVPASNANDARAATCGWVNSKGYLTSHQSLNSCVKTSGDQNIGGAKTFTSDITVQNNAPYLYIKQNDVQAGTTPDSSYSGIHCVDKNGKAYGSIISRFYGGQNGCIELIGYDVTSASATAQANVRVCCHSGIGKIMEPDTNGDILFGRSSHRWKEIWCTQSSINSSSDERDKTAINNIPNEVLDAWENISWLQFKFKDAVKEKLDNARLHTGVIAQYIDKVFKDKGLDASKYGLFLYDKWEKEEDEDYDENGNLRHAASLAGDSYGIRYVEALCMEAAYQRRKNKILENRISELEKQVSDMLQILQNLTSSNG